MQTMLCLGAAVPQEGARERVRSMFSVDLVWADLAITATAARSFLHSLLHN